MASLAEMLQYAAYNADNQTKNSPAGQLIGLADSGLAGYAAGHQFAKQDMADKLDRATKLLDIQKKQGDIEKEALNQKILTNLAKQTGLLPLDSTETTAARTTAFDSLGTKTPAADNTSAGKLGTLYNSAVTTPYNVPKLSFKPNEGLSFTMEKAGPERAPKDPAADNDRIYKLAEEAARREQFNLVSTTLGPDAAAKFANVQPSQDVIQKYIPEMTAYQSGDTAKSKALMAARKAAMAPTSNTLAALQMQSTANSGLKGFIPQAFRDKNQNPLPDIDQETLDTYKSKLLNGASAADLLGGIGAQIKKLADADPVKNRAQIKALVKQKVALMSIGGPQ